MIHLVDLNIAICGSNHSIQQAKKKKRKELSLQKNHNNNIVVVVVVVVVVVQISNIVMWFLWFLFCFNTI